MHHIRFINQFGIVFSDTRSPAVISQQVTAQNEMQDFQAVVE
jgi:hypothetical protein